MVRRCARVANVRSNKALVPWTCLFTNVDVTTVANNPGPGGNKCKSYDHSATAMAPGHSDYRTVSPYKDWDPWRVL
jgi:hypothetical protein